MAFYKDIARYQNENRPDKDVYPDKAEWIAKRLITLRHNLKTSINRKHSDSLIIGSWNIQAFDGGMPRLDESYHYIAEILSAFDICAVQEVKPDIKPLQRIMKLLGPNWDYFVTDASTHDGGNNERMAYLFNKDRVFFRNQIGEIVLNPTADGLIARTPLFASFQASWFRFTVVSAHIRFGDDLDKRANEITLITSEIVKRAKKSDEVFIFLGDMNIESEGDVVDMALTNSDMEVPSFGPTNLGGDRFFDKIAYTVKGKSTRKTRLLNHGIFDWRTSVFPESDSFNDIDTTLINLPEGGTWLNYDDALAHYKPIVDHARTEYGRDPYADFSVSYKKDWIDTEMSDHLPVWIEIETDYSDKYLLEKFIT